MGAGGIALTAGFADTKAFPANGVRSRWERRSLMVLGLSPWLKPSRGLCFSLLSLPMYRDSSGIGMPSPSTNRKEKHNG